MGNFLWKCFNGSPKQILECSDGDGLAYNERFLEDIVLGEGEFGVVKLVHDMHPPTQRRNGESTNLQSANAANRQPMACKVLRKGVVFKDNVLYSPLKPHVLRGEIEMLRTLAGEMYCLRLHAVYETQKCLYVVTEYCAGGQLTEYVAAQHQSLSPFTTNDVQRIASQMFSALKHCSKHNVLHRDIKPDNIMFTDPSPGASIRIIDFGSGCLDAPNSKHTHTTIGNVDEDVALVNGLPVHTTFCGSAFYTSPEMFTRTGYTAVTDVWSMGVTLYVLVAGYPADALQRAFNILQVTSRNLRNLPNLPDDLPASFYTLLEQCLIYNYHDRATAETIFDVNDFISPSYCSNTGNMNGDSFTNTADDVPELTLEQVSAAAAAGTFNAKNGTTNNTTTAGVSLAGSIHRHNLFLGFKKFERSLTALLATMLSKAELANLLTILLTEQQTKHQTNVESSSLTFPNQSQVIDTAKLPLMTTSRSQQPQTLAVIQVSELKSVIRKHLEHQDTVLEAIAKLPLAQSFDKFAYHIVLLIDFARDGAGGHVSNAALNGGSWGRGSAGSRLLTGSTNSLRSSDSRRGALKRASSIRNGSRGKHSASVHGNFVFKAMASKHQAQSATQS